LLGVISAIDNDQNVDISGFRMSGRTTLLRRLGKHFSSLKREVINVAGRPMVSDAPLSAAGLAGLRGDTPFAVAEEIGVRVGDGLGVILVDDWDYVDRETWSALVHVHQERGLPIVVSRGVNRRAAAPFSLPGVARPRIFEMPTYDVRTLGDAINMKFGYALDAHALSRVAALSCGSPGVASVLVASAEEAGLLEVADGRAHMSGLSLWTDGATAVAEALLASVTDEQRTSLEKLSVLGPVDLGTAVAAVGEDMIAELSDLELLRLMPDGTGAARLSLRSALLDEYFLHHPNGVRLALLTPRHVEKISAPVAPPTTMALLSDSYVSSHRAEMEARRAWTTQPGIDTAAALVEALISANAPSDAIEEVLQASSQMTGSPEEIVRWEMLNLRQGIYGRGHVETAVARIAEHARNDPSLFGFYRAAVSLANFVMGVDPELDQLPTNMDGLLPGTDQMIGWAKMYVLVLSGRIEEAREVRATLGEKAAFGVNAFVIISMLTVADGDFAVLAEEIAERFTIAKARSQWHDLAALTYLSGLNVGFYGGKRTAQAHLKELHTLGAPVSNPMTHQGLVCGWTIAFRGTGIEPPPEFAVAPPHPYRSAFPGSHPEWNRALVLMEEGKPEEAAGVATSLADEQWDKGHRLAAALAYQLAAVCDPKPERIGPLGTRVATLGAPGLDGISAWLGVLCQGDLPAAEEMLSLFEQHSLHPTTGASWEVVGKLWEKRGDRIRAAAAYERSETVQHRRAPAKLSAGATDAEDGPTADHGWSRREREVVRYIIAGRTNQEIADALNLSVRTVESHVARAMRKASVGNRSELRRKVNAVS
jgi:DNA-binding CsgD family transcriptional regulator